MVDDAWCRARQDGGDDNGHARDFIEELVEHGAVPGPKAGDVPILVAIVCAAIYDDDIWLVLQGVVGGEVNLVYPVS